MSDSERRHDKNNSAVEKDVQYQSGALFELYRCAQFRNEGNLHTLQIYCIQIIFNQTAPSYLVRFCA